MSQKRTRRKFLAQTGALAAGMTLPVACDGKPDGNAEPRASARAASQPAEPRVVIARDEQLTRGKLDEHRDLLIKLLDAAMQRLTRAPDATTAWRKFFGPEDRVGRVGIKVNTLGLTTQPAVVDAIIAGLRKADVPAGNIIIWDRFDVELRRAGFKPHDGVQCRGTDESSYAGGYEDQITVSGQIGSCFSKILTGQVDTLISVPVLKDHNLAGVSLGMKNFYGAIHNPNKYHENNCDPFVADVVSHPYIRPKWRLTVCDGTRGQCHAGPTVNSQFAWPFGGLIVGADFVAVDAVAADLLEQERKARKMKPLAKDGRPPRHIATAGQRGLGQADLTKIERIEV